MTSVIFKKLNLQFRLCESHMFTYNTGFSVVYGSSTNSIGNSYLFYLAALHLHNIGVLGLAEPDTL